MKNQFFGDKRDYFKYSLLETLVEADPNLKQLTCIWMLTPDMNNTHGSRPVAVVKGHEPLAHFLMECRRLGKRDVREVSRYFDGRPFQFNSYGDDPNRPFGLQRERYFREIPAQYLEGAVVFFDPDNGLEPASGAKPAHVSLEELRAVFSRLDSKSVLVMYQHLPRQTPAIFWPAVARRLAAGLTAPLRYVAESDVAFYVIPKSASQLASVERTLRSYASAPTLGGKLIRQVGAS